LALINKWLNNTESFSRQLDCLTNLHLIHIKSLELPEYFLIQFEFPKLQAFSIIFCDEGESARINSNGDLIWLSIQKLAHLEFLEIQWGIEISSEVLSTLCVSLPKLRYFLYFKRNLKPFEMQMYHELFQKCPSLRVIIHGDPNFYSVKYFKDIGTNSVRQLLWPAKQDFCLEFVYKEIPRKYFPSKSYPTNVSEIEYLNDAYYTPPTEDED